MDSYRHILVSRQGDVSCVRLKHSRLEESEIQQLGQEIISLLQPDQCRNVALSLGPETPRCLYSVFLAKLITIRNAVQKAGGKFFLCEVGPSTYGVFEATMLHREFTFVSDFEAAAKQLTDPANNGQPSEATK